MLAANQVLVPKLRRRLQFDLGISDDVQDFCFGLDSGTERELVVRAKPEDAGQVLTEIERALTELGSLDIETVERAKAAILSKHAGSFERASNVSLSLVLSAMRGKEEDRFAVYESATRALTTANVEEVAGKFMRPNQGVIVVSGDWSRLRLPLAALGWGAIEVVDSNGAPKMR